MKYKQGVILDRGGGITYSYNRLWQGLCPCVFLYGFASI